MARRRKNEAKTSMKCPQKFVAVRKSSRQIAKKQQQEQKVNGDAVQASSNNSDDSKDGHDEREEKLQPLDTIPAVQKKVNRFRRIINCEKAGVEDEDAKLIASLKGENDIYSEIESSIAPSENKSLQNVVICLSNQNHESLGDSASNEVWTEDVIEETIICEEMEVEEVTDNVNAQESSVVVDQVLLVNESDFDGKNVVEFTVIKNADGTESMLMASDMEALPEEEYDNSNVFQSIEEGVGSLRMSESHSPVVKSSSGVTHDEKQFASETASNENYGKTQDVILSGCSFSKTSETDFRLSNKSEGMEIADSVLINTACSHADSFEETVDTMSLRNDCEYKASIEISRESSEEPGGLSALVSMENCNENSTIFTKKMLLLTHDDETNSLDKIEQLNIGDQSISNSVKEKDTTRKDLDDSLDSKNYEGSFTPKLRENQELGNECMIKKTDCSQNIEEHSRDSEMDEKPDFEDVKLSSSSENSSDTLLSANSYKLPELGPDAKNISNLNEAEKKSGFRSRSGSTDTTGSESGSNSSGVRRSSRIRTIGLMKQRTRGRGLVTKPNLDTSKIAFQQNSDKTSSCTPPLSQESKDGFDNLSETQSERENGSCKITTSIDTLSLSASSGTTGYDSDTSKPVKVKSRWRRSSELEMGGTGSLSGCRLGIGFGFPGVGSALTTETPLGAGFTQDVFTAVSVVKSENSGTVSSPSIMESIVSNESSETADITNTSLATVIPKTIGAKISLPMVLEVRDREMEERLSQFEQLNENLYLTERYTSKESKGMLCDCFLTEDEIERGELGCGEDCLNRLLLMECGPRCVVGDRCTNKRFQNCDYAKCEVFRTEKKGFGLRATADLEGGEFIMEYVGEVVDPKDFRKRTKEYSKDKNRHHYFMALKSDQIIDATMKGNVSRFINHSCDPNAETQKWTVNGELRIGFFNKKSIAAGEEITFDYHFQRYGKEAQKCLCEASNCRGWIGETPEEENEKIEKKEKREKDITRKKKEEKKLVDYMEDEDLEEEIDKLCSGGLKNRNHTLTLSRLMVRSRELEHRTRLLRVLQTGEQPCRRLFLDYHGLRLMWSYMMDVAGTETEETQQFRLEVLKTLSTLPIPNKTMLMDSKVYGVVEKWSKQSFSFPNDESPEDDHVKPRDDPDAGSDEKSSAFVSNKEENETGDEHTNDLKQETEQVLIIELASNLLMEWSSLKEVFRIPKKERIEQMKEHEREADRGYKEELDKEQKRETYERYRPDRYGRNETDKRDRRRGRDSPDFEHGRSKDNKRVDERSNLVPVPRMTKFERRQLFALKVAKEEEEERQRRQQQELWKEHETRCLALGMDPHTTSAIDPQTGYPLFFNPAMGQWQNYPIQDGSELQQQMTPVYVGGPQPMAGPSQPNLVSPSPHLLQPGLPIDISPGLQTAIYPMNQTPAYNQQTAQFPPPLPVSLQQFQESPLQIPSNLVQIHNGTPTIPIPGQPMFIDKPVEPPFQASPAIEATKLAPQPEMPPPLDLPPKWKWAKDERGRVYYYHVKERISQWLPPPPDHIGVQPDSSTSSESSDESSSSNDEEEDVEEDRNPDRPIEGMDVDGAPEATIDLKPSLLKKLDFNSSVEIKKKRDGLVQERIISPRREEDRIDHKKFKEMKEKLRRQKERARLKDHVDKGRKHRRSNKSKSHSRHSLKVQTTGVDASPNAERKIKDAFRINMANVMVHFLNPYRKNDCKQGRITNTEDFKHLARKLTHFVLAKELKHCKSVDELQCNENVKHKAKDFVRKYMSKFGAVYQKSTDDD